MTEAQKSVFATLLRQLRDNTGMSQLQLAHATDVSLSHISNMELGYSEPCLGTLINLARALEMLPEDFLKIIRLRLQAEGVLDPFPL